MTDPSVRISSNELCFLWKSDQFLREKFLYLKRSSIGCKKFQTDHPKTIFRKFSFFWEISVKGKLLLVMTDPSLRICSNELCLLWNGDQFLIERFLYLKRSSIGWKNFQRVQPEVFLGNFQFFDKFQYRANFYLLWPTLLSEFAQMNCALTVCSYHVRYAFQSESTLYSCLNVKELLARSRSEIWNLSAVTGLEPTTT